MNHIYATARNLHLQAGGKTEDGLTVLVPIVEVVLLTTHPEFIGTEKQFTAETIRFTATASQCRDMAASLLGFAAEADALGEAVQSGGVEVDTGVES